MSFHWKDAAREELETKAAGDKRELMVHLFYPRDTAATGERAVYLPDAEVLRGEWSDAALTRISAFRSFSYENAPIASGTERYPVAIFLPGGGMKALMNQALIEDLASHGWVVAAVDLPYNAVVRFPDGRVLGSVKPAELRWPWPPFSESNIDQKKGPPDPEDIERHRRYERKRITEHQSQLLVEYQCKWGERSARPTAISQPLHHAHHFQSRQLPLFDPLWIRYPMDLAAKSFQ